MLAKEEDMSEEAEWRGKLGSEMMSLGFLVQCVEKFELGRREEVSSNCRKGGGEVVIEGVFRKSIESSCEIGRKKMWFSQVSTSSNYFQETLPGVVIIVAPCKVGEKTVACDQ